MNKNRKRLEDFVRKGCEFYTKALLKDVQRFKKDLGDPLLDDRDVNENDKTTESDENIAEIIREELDTDKVLRMDKSKTAHKFKKKEVKDLYEKDRLREKTHHKHKTMKQLYRGAVFTGFLLCDDCEEIMSAFGGSVVRHIRKTCKIHRKRKTCKIHRKRTKRVSVTPSYDDDYSDEEREEREYDSGEEVEPEEPLPCNDCNRKDKRITKLRAMINDMMDRHQAHIKTMERLIDVSSKRHKQVREILQETDEGDYLLEELHRRLGSDDVLATLDQVQKAYCY